MKFEAYNIAEEIKESLDKLGFKRPTDIQFKAIPSIMLGEDVLAIAQTGTGKTAAFVIPILNVLHKNRRSNPAEGVRCLVMVPTHELAQQITKVFDSIGELTKVKTLTLIGGVAQAPQIEMLKKGVDVLVATPGRMFDLLSQGHLHLEKVEILVLDEADHMLDLGFIHDIRALIEKIPRQRQTLFFSATIDDKIKKLAYSLVKNAIRIQISPKDLVTKNVHHSVAYVSMDDKRYFLERIAKEYPDSKIMVFVRTKVRAERVQLAMQRVEIVAEIIHGGKEQVDRENALEKFKAGDVKMLIATDVSARGIDVASVNFVVNYDLPDLPENYVHRVGRTGRGVQRGRGVSFCSPEEKPLLDAIEDYLGKEIEVAEINKTEYQETISFSSETHTNWKSLIKKNEEELKLHPKKKKKK